MRSEYQDYLATPEWKRTAEIVKVLAGDRCEVCFGTDRLEAHHRDYRFRGTAREVLDCIALCEKCHELYHQSKSQSSVIEVEFHSQNPLRKEANELQREIEDAQTLGDNARLFELVSKKVELEKKIQAGTKNS